MSHSQSPSLNILLISPLPELPLCLQGVESITFLKSDSVDSARLELLKKDYHGLLLLAPYSEWETLDAIAQLHQLVTDMPVLVCADIDDDFIVELLRAGVQDVLHPQDSTERLQQAMHSAIARKYYEASLRHQSQYDALTGLANRALFRDRFQHALNRGMRNSRTTALLLINIDRFKLINESLGQDAGDKLIQDVARRLKGLVRKSDTLARLGGDEFAVVLEDVQQDHVISMIASKTMDALAAPYHLKDEEIFITLSMGIDYTRETDDGIEKLFRQADIALHRAKLSGRQGIEYYTPDMNISNKLRMTLESGLHYALQRSEFSLQYQPQIDINTGDFAGAEALLRWHHPTAGLISPNVFIPLLEETGLIIDVGLWVLRMACMQRKHWVETRVLPDTATVSVNISSVQFRREDLVEQIISVLNETGLPAHLLTLEITESTLMENLQGSLAGIETLRELGVEIAIDDFGTGYSSLSYLKNLPIDYLKIDRAFVKDLASDDRDAAIANSIIVLAHNLGLRVVAEGVEDVKALKVLESYACDQYQGYLFARPVDPEQLPTLAIKSA